MNATTAACSRCGAPVSAGTRFCPSCGADVSGQQGSVATAFVQAPDLQRLTLSSASLLQVLREATVGEYEIITQLGQGGMATVFLGHEIALDRKVAIKVMSPALITGEGMVERFKREARTSASLSHPNIIPIYAVREAPQLVYFVMKFVEGRPLDSIIKEAGALPIPMVLQILQQAGAGLDYAHKRGIVHRDVKPGNIMVDTDGWAIVTDFGIAKVTQEKGLTMTGATVGTPSYMSPEQCAAKDLTGAADQYSLGVVAYEMLSGKLPFQADSIMAIMYAHFNEPPPPIQEARPDCPPAVADAVMRMLAKDPADRFPTVADAVAAMGAIAMAADDPVRTQLLTLAASGLDPDKLKRMTTPVSPMPRGRTNAAKTAVTTQGLDFAIDPAAVSVAVGGAVQLTAKLRGAGARTLVGPTVSWASTKPEVATVSPGGLVTAAAPGEALITCTCQGKSATATITVTGAKKKVGLLVGAGVLAVAAAALIYLKPWAPAPPAANPPAQEVATTPAGGPQSASQAPAASPGGPDANSATPPPARPASKGGPAQTPARTPERPAPKRDQSPVRSPVTTAPQQAAAASPQSTSQPAATAAAPAVAAPPPIPDPTPAINDAVAACVRALNKRSVPEVDKACPGLTDGMPGGGAAFQDFFKTVSSFTAALSVAGVDHASGQPAATARVTGTYNYTVQGSHPPPQPQAMRAVFEYANGAWHLTSITSAK